jgi:hypothetical protein
MKALKEIRSIKAQQRDLAHQLREASIDIVHAISMELTELSSCDKDHLLALFLAREEGVPEMSPVITAAMYEMKI